MTDEELIARLRSVHTSADDEAAADRIEALVRKLAWTEAKLEAEELTSGFKLSEANARAERLEAALRFYARRGVVSPWVDDEINEDGGDIARAALKGDNHDG